MHYTIELIRLIAVILITFTHIKHGFNDGPMYYILEVIPKYGTLILSLVSGFLYNEVSSKNSNSGLVYRKIKSLLLPYLIANVLVITPVLVLNYFGYNFLNRLNYDYTLITQGILSLSSPPINPPTYFIRDLFIIFLIVSLIRNKTYSVLIILIPLAVFGKILLRFDILILFTIGVLFSMYRYYFEKYLVSILLFASALVFLFFNYLILFKYVLTILLFINVMRIKLGFVKTGGYTYLLHLYHAPIIVFLYPLINKYIESPYLKVFLQIGIVTLLSLILFKVIRVLKLNVVIGNR